MRDVLRRRRRIIGGDLERAAGARHGLVPSRPIDGGLTVRDAHARDAHPDDLPPGASEDPGVVVGVRHHGERGIPGETNVRVRDGGRFRRNEFGHGIREQRDVTRPDRQAHVLDCPVQHRQNDRKRQREFDGADRANVGAEAPRGMRRFPHSQAKEAHRRPHPSLRATALVEMKRTVSLLNFVVETYQIGEITGAA